MRWWSGADGKKEMTEQESARMRRVGSGKDRVTLETASWMARKAMSTQNTETGAAAVWGQSASHSLI